MINLFNLDSTDDFEYLLSQVGKDVIVNGAATATRVMITNANAIKNYDDKFVSSLSPLSRGDIVDYDGKKFMIISEESGKRYSKWKGLMRLLPFSITFVVSCVFIRVPAFIETQTIGIQNGQIMSIADGKIYLNVPENEDVQKIQISHRFIKSGQAFVITGVDRYSKHGMVVLTCQKDPFNATDDLVNEIAGGLSCPVDITNTDPVEVFQGQVLQIAWTTTQNEPVVFISSNESIATVDASGLVTGISIGQVTITMQNASNGLISDTVSITVKDLPASYSLTITSASTTPNEIKKNQNKSYHANVYNGTTLITDGSQTVVWSLWDDTQTTSTTLATISTQNGTDCTVLNNAATSGYIQLRAMLNSNNTIVGWIRIQMKPLI